MIENVFCAVLFPTTTMTSRFGIPYQYIYYNQTVVTTALLLRQHMVSVLNYQTWNYWQSLDKCQSQHKFIIFCLFFPLTIKWFYLKSSWILWWNEMHVKVYNTLLIFSEENKLYLNLECYFHTTKKSFNNVVWISLWF